MSNEMDFQICDGMSLKTLCQNIIENSKTKRNQLELIIYDIKDKMKNVNDVIVLAPIIKDMIDAGIRNDEVLTKVASVAQRIISSKAIGSSSESSGILTDEEKRQLMMEVKTQTISEKQDESVPVPVLDIKK